MRYLCGLSERISFVIGQNAGGKTLILQASSPAVSDTLFDSSQAQRLQHQSVYAEVVYRLSLYRSFLSLCYRRSVEAIVALPLVLPPTVLGFYLLLALGPHSGGPAVLEQKTTILWK